MIEGPLRRATGAALGIAAVLALGYLLSGSGYLEYRLPGGLPVGNAASAACLILASGAAALMTSRNTLMGRFCVAAAAIAILWLPVSITLAGNLDLNFEGSTATAWFALTAVALLASFGSLVAALVSSARRKRRILPRP